MLKGKAKIVYAILIMVFAMSFVACSKGDKEGNNNQGGNTPSEGSNGSGDEGNAEGNNSGNGGSVEAKGPFVPNPEAFEKTLVTIGGKEYSYREVMLYYYATKMQYESMAGSSIWDYDFGEGKKFADMAKEGIMEEITQFKVIIEKAAEYNVVLTDEEEAEITANAKELLENLPKEEVETYGITKEIAETYFRDFVLYQRILEAATMNVDNVVSDEEAKQITVQHLLVMTVKRNEDGSTTPYTEEEKAEARKKIEELYGQAKETDDFKKLAETNTEDGGVEYTFGKGEMVAAFETAAFALKPGELSEIVETEYGYHIIYCVSDFEEDATLDKKEEIIKQRQTEEFAKLSKTWAEESKIEINEELWATVYYAATPVDTGVTEPGTDAGTTDGDTDSNTDGNTDGTQE